MLLAFAGKGDWRSSLYVVLGVVGVMALYVAVRLLWDLWQRRRTKGWVVATATVTEVEWDRESGLKGNSSAGYTRVTVHYTYMGTTEHKATYTFNKDSHEAAVTLAKSLLETTFAVRYDPGDEAHPVVLMADRAG